MNDEYTFRIDKGLIEGITTPYTEPLHGKPFFRVDKDSLAFRNVVDLFERTLTAQVFERGPCGMSVTVTAATE